MPIHVPSTPVREGSFQIFSSKKEPFALWSSQDHAEAFDCLKKISTYWKEKGKTEEFIVYGKQMAGEKSFSWEIIPVYPRRKILNAFREQLSVLSNLTFGDDKTRLLAAFAALAGKQDTGIVMRRAF